MRLKVRNIPIETGFTPVVMITHHDAIRYDLHPRDRVLVETAGRKRRRIIAAVDVSNRGNLPNGTIGLFVESSRELGVRDGSHVDIHPAQKPDSLHHIKRKMDGEALTDKEYDQIVKDIVGGDIDEVELAYFVSAIAIRNITLEEVASLTRAIARNGSRYRTRRHPVVDKHCIGGIPGNRTTMVVVPILAACGLTVPKTSSRAITSPSGTADTMEALCEVDLSLDEMRRVVTETGACMMWGGAIGLAPADDKIIQIEKPMSIDVSGLMMSSVMAKKYSVGATHVLIDIPYGHTAKVPSRARAEELRRHFHSIGKLLGMQMVVVLTDGRQPIGKGIGPALEAQDVLAVLQCEPHAPLDLREKSLRLAAELLEFIGHVPRGEGYALARGTLDSGKAWLKMSEIIRAQGARTMPEPGRHRSTFRASTAGVIREIDNKAISKLARLAGAPITKGAGLYLHRKLGEYVAKGDQLFTAYADSTEKLRHVRKYYALLKPYTIRE